MAPRGAGSPPDHVITHFYCTPGKKRPNVKLAKPTPVPRLCGSNLNAMIVDWLNGFWAMMPPRDGQQSQPWWSSMVPLLLMVFVFYFIFIRPQQKKVKEHDTLLKTLRTGDKILTNSGIVGIVVGVKEKSVSIRSADTKLEILKSAVSEITERGSESAEA